MSLNSTPSGERLHIGFFGMCNAGKSSLVNAFTNQNMAIVSEKEGTTTDPVRKSMELLPLGPVVIIDTPGLDDAGELGELRKARARDALAKADVAVLVVDAITGLRRADNELIAQFESRKLPFVIAYNKSDLLSDRPSLPENAIYVSARTRENVDALKQRIGGFAPGLKSERRIVADLLKPDDVVVLVIPVDEAAPKGRLILPQQQTMRDILDAHCAFISCQHTELKSTLAALKNKPGLVITDSQAFGSVARDVPEDVMLTSFSILFARYKGDLPELVKGAAQLMQLRDGDRVLISEGCTHHRQCSDIGTVKIPGWIEAFTGVKPVYEFTSGAGFPDDLSPFRLIVHCGGCMLTEKEIACRIERAKASGVPIVNYGVAIAHMHGILRRSLQPFPEILYLLDKKN